MDAACAVFQIDGQQHQGTDQYSGRQEQQEYAVFLHALPSQVGGNPHEGGGQKYIQQGAQRQGDLLSVRQSRGSVKQKIENQFQDIVYHGRPPF